MLRTGQSPAPFTRRSSSASTPGSRPTPGAALPGTLASPRAGLPPAGCRELVARLRRGVLLSVLLGARATGRTLLRNRLGWVLAAGRPGSGRPWGRRGRRPAPPGPGSRAAAGGPAGTQRALDAAWDRRGIGRVAATTAGPRPGAGARPRRRRSRRGRSLARGGCPRRRSGPRGVGGPGPSAIKVAAPAPAVRLGLELALKLQRTRRLESASQLTLVAGTTRHLVSGIPRLPLHQPEPRAVGPDVRVASCSAAATTAAIGWPRSSATR
jgi:hypothetical protein